MLDRNKSLILFPFLLVFYEMANYLANDMYLPALPHIVSDFNTTAHLAQQTLTMFFFGSASLTLILGPLSDRFGRRPILLGGGIVFLVSTLFCTFSPSIQVLLVARFFQGCSVCVIGTAGYSTVHELYDQIKAIKILAIMGSIVVIAPAFGPLFGAIVLHWLNWRWIFGILFIWAALVLILLWFIMPETCVMNIKEASASALNAVNIVKSYWRIISNRNFIIKVLMLCAGFMGMIAWIAAGPFLVISKFHYSPLMFGIFQVFVFGSLIIGSIVVNRIVEKVGPERLISIGVIIGMLSSLLALLLALLFPTFIWGLVISLMLFSFGESLAFSSASRIAIEASTEPMGARMAVFSTLTALAGTVGGLLVSYTYSDTLLWFAGFLVILSSIACGLRWMDRRLG